MNWWIVAIVGLAVFGIAVAVYACLRVSGEYDREMQRRWNADDAGWEDSRHADQ